MTKKTTKPKVAKKAVKKQAKVSKSAVMIAILAAVVVFGVLTALIVKEKHDFAVKQDRARFTEVERRLESLREKLSANGEEWKIEKSCREYNSELLWSEEGSCDVILYYKGKASMAYTELETNINASLGTNSGTTGYDDNEEKTFVDINGIGLSDIGCTLDFNKNEDISITEDPRVICSGSSMKMYFSEV